MGGVIAPLGVVIVLLGWWGASRTPHVFEQVPYLISGGLLGIALVFLGAFFYFAHWLTELVREHRTQSAAIVDALTRLQDQVAELSPAPPAAGRALDLPRAGAHHSLVPVATPRRPIAHRPESAVGAGLSPLLRAPPPPAPSPPNPRLPSQPPT